MIAAIVEFDMKMFIQCPVLTASVDSPNDSSTLVAFSVPLRISIVRPFISNVNGGDSYGWSSSSCSTDLRSPILTHGKSVSYP